MTWNELDWSALDRLREDLRLVIDVVDPAGDAERVLGAAECRDRLLERLRLASGDHHPGAVGDQPLGDPEADTSARPGDDRRTALEPAGHRSSCVLVAVTRATLGDRGSEARSA